MSAGGAGGPRCSSGPRSSSLVFIEERCVDPVEDRPPTQKTKPYLTDANGKESETIGFIPGSAETTPASQTCNPCTSQRSCKTFVCSVLTCGLYWVCQRSVLAPCLAPNESSPEEAESRSLRAANPENNTDNAEDTGIPLGNWNDICIGGVRVVSPGDCIDPETESSQYVSPVGVTTQPEYRTLHESVRFDDWEVDEEDVDSLITKKLLELYSEYQIEELARCTSDSVFLKKTKDINQLINSLAEEHKMDEQEAECRLVRGIIRISTRKSKKKKQHVPKMDRMPSDSGNETWNGSSSFSFSNNNDYRSSPNIQISELTPSDKFARDMWRKNGGHSSGSPTAYSPSQTQTDSSGVPLTCSSART
ncbi:keratinocyte differentiation factor 1 [Xenentodon cancila]